MQPIAGLICAMAVAAMSVSLAFNIDTTSPLIYPTPQKEFFKNKVLQNMTGEDKGILTTSQQQDQLQYRNQTHQCLIIPDISLINTTSVKYFGLSISEDSICSHLSVCRPNVAHEYYDNVTCYHQLCPLTPAQEYTKKTVNLVFLFDGSLSMTQREFNKNKDFIVDIMKSLSNSSIKFAAVQFSTETRTVFDFNDYQAGTALDILRNEPHMRGLTNTHKALEFVLDELFENPGAGASPDATKVLVLITDGDPSDRDRNEIIKTYGEKHIIRFVIGVRVQTMDEFKAIASEGNAFKIEEYEGLTGILENFQKKILNVEATEMAQIGFSAVMYKTFSPNKGHRYDENAFLNGVCYKMKDHPVQISFPPASQECTKKTVDLVFLFDGSQSMTQRGFNKNKDFIVDIMKSLSNSSIKFAAVQFSTETRTVFDFNDYQAGTALDILWKEPHMRGLTNTHKALNFVLDELFENPGAGASPDATKVLVLITDGDPSDRDRNGIIKTYGEKHIIRFVIGVRVRTTDKFKAMASEGNAFKIEEYEGLTGILENFQKKILEATEMAQIGFSAVMYKDSLILGSVGSNSWRGQVQIEDVQMEKDSYLGYSISVGQKNGILLYFAGAPRFEHKGQVVVFRHDHESWIVEQRINADQIGSYFGAELCSVDIDSDGNTDFLLVGAPLFYQSQEKTEGQIYVYKLTEEMKLEIKLNVSAVSVGRFGTSISSLADVNGDGLRDIAVGAPLEDKSRGAVYIFLGDRHRGIRSTFSQRIMGRQINPELRYFGLAVDGDIDHGEDGLPDIVVRSQNMTVVMRYA